MNRIAGVVLFLMVSSGLSSCGLLKKGGRKKDAKDTTAAVAVADSPKVAMLPVARKDTAIIPVDSSAIAKQLIEDVRPIWKNRFTYKTFSGKAKVNYTGPESTQDFTANFRVKKDSVIWIAITGLGGLVPVARIYITPDSFFMMDQLHKEYIKMPLKDAAKVLPTSVEFSSLQNLIVGEPIREGEISGAQSTREIWSVDVYDKNYFQHVTYSKPDSTMKSCRLGTKDNSGLRAVIEYVDYAMVKGRRLSTGRIVNLQNSKDTHTLDMNFSNTDFDQVLEFPFSIPRNYSPKKP